MMDLDVALFVYSFFAGAFLLFLTGKGGDGTSEICEFIINSQIFA